MGCVSDGMRVRWDACQMGCVSETPRLGVSTGIVTCLTVMFCNPIGEAHLWKTMQPTHPYVYVVVAGNHVNQSV